MSRPLVMCFSGHDPSGGAGIQADIETLISHRCHPCSVITALTEQDTHNVKRLLPQLPQDIIDQATTLLNDLPVAAFKIGLIGDATIAAAIAKIISAYPHLPVVLDPVLAAGGGTVLASNELIDAINRLLLPLTTVITPNSLEARKLTQCADLPDCAERLLQGGVANVLITGSHEDSPQVHNQLFRRDQPSETFSWQRLPHSYHGSGCTLASAIAALLAHGLDVFTAVNEAQDYTWNTLAAGYHPGHGQFNPDRLFWIDA